MCEWAGRAIFVGSSTVVTSSHGVRESGQSPGRVADLPGLIVACGGF